MADLTDLQSALTVKVVGANSGGTETNAVDASALGLKGDIAAVGGTALALGQTTTSASIPVTIASNQPIISVTNVPLDGTKTTYSAAANLITTATSPTDVFTLTGSATKTVRVLSVEYNASTSSGSGLLSSVVLIKRSAANTGGTSTTTTVVPHDSTNAAATAVARSYTANPSGLGASVGNIRATRISYQSASGNAPIIRWEFGDRPGQGVVLRGVAEVLAVNLNAVTVTGGIASCSFEWTEE